MVAAAPTVPDFRKQGYPLLSLGIGSAHSRPRSFSPISLEYLASRGSNLSVRATRNLDRIRFVEDQRGTNPVFKHDLEFSRIIQLKSRIFWKEESPIDKSKVSFVFSLFQKEFIPRFPLNAIFINDRKYEWSSGLSLFFVSPFLFYFLSFFFFLFEGYVSSKLEPQFVSDGSWIESDPCFKKHRW